jgi:small-conductance mechanosensitive channel
VSGETEEHVSGWTVDTLKEYMDTQFTGLRDLLSERYETQTKAVESAFLAQQTAMQAALTAAERAVATALLSAEKAVGKAEVAAEKRFESVNEFRAQLTDQAATFVRRDEVDIRIRSLTEKVSEVELRLTSRLDSIQGQSKGGADNRAQGLVILGAGVGIVGVAIALYVALIR